MIATNYVAPYSTQLALPLPRYNGSFAPKGVCYPFTPYDDSFVMCAMLWAVIATSILNHCFKSVDVPKDNRDSEIQRLHDELVKAQDDYRLLEEDLQKAEEDLLEAEEERLRTLETLSMSTQYFMSCLKNVGQSESTESTESAESTESTVSSSPPPPTLVSSICALLERKKATARELFVELFPTNPSLTKSEVNSCLYKLKARSIATFTQGPKKPPMWSLC